MRLTFLPDVLDEHLDELGFLWAVRQGDLRSPDEPFRSFLETEERIGAHLHGVRVLGERAVGRLEQGLDADEPGEVLAAALPLLHLGREERERVMEAFRSAEPDRLSGLTLALAHGPRLEDDSHLLQRLVATADEHRAVAAARVLCFQGEPPALPGLSRWRSADDPVVRRDAWYVTACVGGGVEPRAYADGVRDPDPAVRQAALEAAGWAGERGLLGVGRSFAGDPAPEDLPVLRLFAALAGPAERPVFEALARASSLGPARFDLLASYGDPALIPVVVEACGSDDPEEAAGAARAFTRLTGVAVERGEVVVPPPAAGGGEPDPMETEFAEAVPVPDVTRVREAWEALAPRLHPASRVVLGMDATSPAALGSLPGWDMRARWELFFRARWSGRWGGSPADLERFPQSGG